VNISVDGVSPELSIELKYARIRIVLWIDASPVYGETIDAVIEASAGKRAIIKRFVVVFSRTCPERDYVLPATVGGRCLSGA
jgi:hypothetical protein